MFKFIDSFRKKPVVIQLSTLGGEFIPEPLRSKILTEHATHDGVRALVQVIEELTGEWENRAQNVKNVQNGTTVYYTGGKSALTELWQRIGARIAQ